MMADIEDWTQLSQMDPEFEKLLQTLPEPPSLSDVLGHGISTMRTHLSAAKQEMNDELGGDAHLDEVFISDDTTVPARDGYQIPVRIYKPIAAADSPPSAGHPLVILFHGGGFCLGGLENEELLSRKLAAAPLRCVVVNVDYRLAPEHPFPAAVNDAWDVVQWAATNTATPALTPANPTTAGFIVGGVSAGANLSAVVGTLARDARLSPPLTGLLLSVPPVFDSYVPPAAHAASLRSFAQNADAPVLDRAGIDAFFGAYAPDRGSPLFNLYSEREMTSRAGLPPVYFQVCGLDPLRDEGLVLERELRTEHGTPTKLQLYPGLPHSFWSFFPQLRASKQWPQDTLEGVEWLLKTTKEGKAS